MTDAGVGPRVVQLDFPELTCLCTSLQSFTLRST